MKKTILGVAVAMAFSAPVWASHTGTQDAAKAGRAQQAAAAVNPIGQPPAGVERTVTSTEILRSASGAVPLSDRVRMQAARDWERSGTAAALVGTNGAVEYAYGQSRPTITCAPLQVCTIKLIAGEDITSMALGDTVRWLVQSSEAGETPVIMVKPTQEGISTNLVITTTEGRVYYLHLIASKTEYVPMVSFFDPARMVQVFHDNVARAQAAREAAEARARAEQQAQAARVVHTAPSFDVRDLDFDFRCEGQPSLKPTRVFATKTHTYVQMSPEIVGRDAPAIFNLGNGQAELMNTRLDRGFYIVDGLPTKFQLVLGVGRSARTVECVHATHARRAAASAVSVD